MLDVFTDAGFNRPTYDELLGAQLLRAKELFGDDIETDEKTALGKFIRLQVYDLAIAYEALEGVYYANFPSTASGVSLDRLCVFKGIHRNSATCAVHKITLSAAAGTVIPEGFKFSTENGVEFVTHERITLSATAEITVYAAEPGSGGNVANGAIAKIVNPENGIFEITNSLLVEAGADVESDYALRQRLTDTASQSGSGTADSIRSAVLAVDGVRGCQIIEDTTNHSFTCYVSAPTGKADDIAQAIFDKKPIGIVSSPGAEDFGTAIDVNGESHQINFTFVDNTPIYIKIKVLVSSKFPLNGIDEIKNNLIAKTEKLGIGDDVIFSALYSCIYAVEGVEEVTQLSIGVAADDVKMGNISISQSQIAVLSAGNIEVETA